MPSRPKGAATVAKRATALEKLEVTYLPPDKLRPNSYNPNRQDPKDFALLLRSMQEDGFTQPVVAQRDTYEIVDGEHRWRAARELGLPEIPVVLVDMEEAQMRLSTLRHNRARGSEDLDLSAAVFRDLRELGALDAAQNALNLDQKELDRILDDEPAPEALAGDDFGQAWEPTGMSHARSEKEERTSSSGAPRIESSTPQALEELRRAEEQAAAATTEEERVAALQSREIYRISLSYTSEDAEVVAQVLGDRPAARLVELCRARYQPSS